VDTEYAADIASESLMLRPDVTEAVDEVMEGLVQGPDYEADHDGSDYVREFDHGSPFQ